MELGFNYSVLKQVNPSVFPVAGGFGPTGLQQTFGMSVNWHLRPIE
jgi:hypothetical protein